MLVCTALAARYTHTLVRARVYSRSKMADWDEGEVFYADQGLAATPDDTPTDIELGYLPAPATTRKAFRLFLSTFEVRQQAKLCVTLLFPLPT